MFEAIVITFLIYISGLLMLIARDLFRIADVLFPRE